ncbi:MAG: DNA polymerase III subunits gamma and tau [uncultured Ramlibacter sp.]|uniref:DNA polymerase III subunit gamma/tau n=1 Tax=uncultured Ramlibacter sp. TaxID=260755 RepID=A0A6J4PWD7_9BURK|nr:MAG: DNA polymerase III subunits gamma and tau [uncultured Ramlibacter sp.]
MSCSDLERGRCVDTSDLDAASNRGVDEVQSLLEQAVYKPVQGRFKVFMIDEVHMLTGHAFNAMLKTLEEPPEYLKFVLATTDPQKVPVTVLSRCLQFNLRPMAPETVQEHLATVLAAEGIQADPSALRLLARAARGSMRDALSLTDQAIAFGGGSLQEPAVRQMLGSVDRSHVFQMIEALAAGNGRTVVEVSEALRLHGLSAAGALEEMAAVLQRMAVVQAVPDMADAADPDAAEIARLAGLLPRDETQLLYTICLHGRAELGLAPDEYAALTMVLLRLLAFKPGAERPAPAAAEKKTLSAAQPSPERAPATTRAEAPALAARNAAPAPARPASTVPARAQPAPATATVPAGQVLPVVVPASSRAAATPPREPHSGNGEVVGVPVRVQPEPREPAGPVTTFVATEEGDFWYATVQQLVAGEAVTALVRELALQSQLVARDTGHWLLRVERESLNQPVPRDRLQAALRGAGHEVNLSIEIGPVSDSPARRNAAAAAQRQRAAEEVILNDPFVQQMMRDFGARIVPGSIKPV